MISQPSRACHLEFCSTCSRDSTSQSLATSRAASGWRASYDNRCANPNLDRFDIISRLGLVVSPEIVGDHSPAAREWCRPWRSVLQE